MPNPTPPKLSITNLDSTETIRAQFNPTEFSVAAKAVWNKIVVPGFSHPLKQFSHTEDRTMSFDLEFRVSAPSANATNAAVQRIVDSMRGSLDGGPNTAANRSGIARWSGSPLQQTEPPFTLDDRFQVEAFLLSLVVPRGGAGILAASPPPVLILWPNFMSMEAVVDGVDLKYTRFAKNGAPVQLTATVNVSDIHDMRFTSEEVRFQGFDMARKQRPQEV